MHMLCARIYVLELLILWKQDLFDRSYGVVLRQDLVRLHATGVIAEPHSQTQTQTQNKTPAPSCRRERSGPVEVSGESRFGFFEERPYSTSHQVLSLLEQLACWACSYEYQ